MTGIRVAIADDHPVVLTGLASFLAGQDTLVVVAQHQSVASAASLREGHPEVVLMDVRMPGVTPGVIAQLDAEGVRVLLFTRAPAGDRVASLLQAGARGVVSKDADLEELVAAIEHVSRGGRHESEPRRQAPHHGLSDRERAVFDALITSKRPKEIAFELGLSLSTVYTYAERVRQKLGVDGLAEVIAYAHREGLIDGV